jgi:putative solute:sodium symporter small subunit
MRSPQPDSTGASDGREKTRSGDLKAYWTRNLRYLAVLLVVWFTVSFGFGILLAPALNEVRIGGFRLGFWFAQQGAIYVFVAIIFVYTWLMNRLDREYGVHEGDSTMESEVH